MKRILACKVAHAMGSGLAITLGLALLSGCGPTPEVARSDGAGAQSRAPQAALTPATSINAMMVGLVDHAAHHIWDLGRDGMAPQTDRDWDEVAHASIQLIAAGSAITSGGTGAMDAGWVLEPDWVRWADALSGAGATALDAANARDLEAVLGAGDVLIETCEGCHSQFKPESPTEGIVHPHYYEE